jgi:hypothetical protein
MQYRLELGPNVREVVCECCGQIKNRVWGTVSRDNVARAVYFALLNIDEPEPRVGLTLSVGPWSDEANPAERRWVQIEIRRIVGEVKMRVSEPAESNFYPWELGGKPLSRSEALTSELISEFWAVADFIVAEDPALVSYLISAPVDAKGREFVSVNR